MSRSRSSKERGQSLTELGVGFTIILLIIGGIVDIGSMMYSYLALRDTAQEGAIYASYHPTDTAGIVTRIKSSATYPLDASQLTNITVSCSGASCSSTSVNSCQGSKVTVQVIFNYQIVMPLMGSVIGAQTVPLNATVTDTILMSNETTAGLKTLSPPQSCP
ncbi:MAG TPA: TadE/TadG family type IV pilus assembly protein [Anaerolineaceae bacterium]|jgi:Flp pilus assembly protein TadG